LGLQRAAPPNLTANVLVQKLASFGELTADDEAAWAQAAADTRRLGSKQMIVAEGDAPGCAHAIVEGFACRYKLLPDGGRQILDFLVPGDLCDGHALFLAEMDHNIATLSECLVAFIPHKTLLSLTEAHPRIARALWWSSLVQESIAREWIANVGRRSADQRIAHLLSELCFRLHLVGLAHHGQYHLPIRQMDLADATGLSVVHTNRVLKKLRQAGLLDLKQNLLTVPNIQRLEEFCGFDRAYLHPHRRAHPLTGMPTHVVQ
jgi:CRP-like cAMP-binding protein